MDAGALLDLLGNENRRRILQLLSRKPCYVTEISEHLDVSPKAVIDHLRKLEEAGLIESRVDDQRRKYFHIAEHLLLEVTVAPFGFGMKSAYPASPGFDLSRCQYLSLEATATRAGHGPEVDAESVARLAEQLEELESIQRELSLAHRWVQSRLAGVFDELSGRIEDWNGSIDADILAALAAGADSERDISRDVDAPPAQVHDRLRTLEDRGLVRRDDGAWTFAG